MPDPTFTITPTHFEIEDHPLCLWDTLSIYTSKTSDGTYNKKPHYFFCGSMTDSFDYYDDYDNGNKYAQIAGVSSRVMNKAITIEGNHAKIDFISDSQVGKRGFRLHIEKPELCPNDFWEPNNDYTDCNPQGVEMQCDPAEVQFKANVAHLYKNLDQSKWSNVKVNFGSCIGNSSPDSNGWISETFSSTACNGDLSQDSVSGQIGLSWKIKGQLSASSGDLVATPDLSFDVKCLYNNNLSINTGGINVNGGLVIKDSVISQGDLLSRFSLESYSDYTYTFKSNEVHIGHPIYFRVSTDLNLNKPFSYQVTECSAHQYIIPGFGKSYTVLKDTCSPDSMVKFDNSDLIGNWQGDTADFKFNSFVFSFENPQIYLK